MKEKYCWINTKKSLEKKKDCWIQYKKVGHDNIPD